MISQVKLLAEKYFNEILKVRRHLHKFPELSFKEFKTSEFVQDFLKVKEIPFTSGHVKTGIVAQIKGKNPDKQKILLRADLDALPIHEENQVDYKSVNNGIMHACGHDVHTSSLLGAMLILNDLRDSFEGTIECVFQPGEEVLPGGAKLMIAEGLLSSPPKCCIAQHVFPDLEAGKVGFKSGMYMASTDEIHVTVKGKGGHAALPNKLIDPVLMAAQLITNMQQIVSRNNHPTDPSVLSFGYVKADGATNVIPDQVHIKGTFRTFNEKWRKEAHLKMKKLAQSICTGMGGECAFEIREGYPFLENDVSITKIAKDAAEKYLGKENVTDLPLRMTAEDFSYFSQVSPSCFYRLGTGNENNLQNLHSSTFNVDESALKTAMGLMSYIAIKQLS
jgi:amidohydrolase